ncbi:calnexin isoform X2 [Orussus abietinus]|uniref:calnexin isoform X2 n=1 Tax=Orussus abietinus TaxID=222816 RepID=UPI0006268769|nr:calnexin isoform X2 [Orussus abietinus]
MIRLVTYATLFLTGTVCGGANAHDDVHGIGISDTVSEPIYKQEKFADSIYLLENFNDLERFKQKWIISETKKNNIDEEIAKYDGKWMVEEPKRNMEEGDLGLVLKSKARHAAISAPLSRPFRFEDKPLVVQYEVNFQEGQECGGAYLKLLALDSEQRNLKEFHDKTPYSIMFGPDKCGNDVKLHFIFRHKNPLNGSYEEKHCKKSKDRLDDIFTDKLPHLYTLTVRPDNTFDIKVDNKVVNSGSLLDDFVPPVNPPLEVEDPTDTQPSDWDDREKIPDPLAKKPEDWDEDAPAQIVDEEDAMPEDWAEDESPAIPNPESTRPEDWDVEMDGEWEPPKIPNPKCAQISGCGPYKQRLKTNPRYKGKWLPPLVNNPNYKGKWKPRLVHNPEYFNDEHPFGMTPIFAVGFELWSMSPDILFDNILVTDNEEVAEKWAEDTFEVRRTKIAAENWSLWRELVTFTAEHPWMWAVHILVAGLPVLLLIHCCCFSTQDKHDTKSEDEEPLRLNDEGGDEMDKDETKDPDPKEGISDSGVAEPDETEEQSERKDSDRDKPLASGDGPRRRKITKE